MIYDLRFVERLINEPELVVEMMYLDSGRGVSGRPLSHEEAWNVAKAFLKLARERKELLKWIDERKATLNEMQGLKDKGSYGQGYFIGKDDSYTEFLEKLSSGQDVPVVPCGQADDVKEG